MQTFNKVFIRTLAFLLCVVIGSAAFLVPAASAKDYYTCTIDDDVNYIFCGASQCAMAIIPSVVDERLGVKSFNLSSQRLKFNAKYELLKNIIKTRQIDTVVMEISNDALMLDDKKRDGGDDTVYNVYKNYLSKKFILKHIINCDFLQMRFNQKLDLGYKCLLNKVRGIDEPVVVENSENHGKNVNKGYEEYETVDVALSHEEIIDTFDETKYELKIIKQNLDTLSECIRLCRENNVNVILLTIPVSDRMIWQNKGYDSFYNFISSFAAENVCPFYDFNLLHARYRHFSDSESYYNRGHLSKTGATQCSIDYCSLINKIKQGKDVSTLFYSSYEEMRNDSPYMEYFDSYMGTDHKNPVIDAESVKVSEKTTEPSTEQSDEKSTVQTEEEVTEKTVKSKKKQSKSETAEERRRTSADRSVSERRQSTTAAEEERSTSRQRTTTTQPATTAPTTHYTEPYTTQPTSPYYEEPTIVDDFSLYDFLFDW